MKKEFVHVIARRPVKDDEAIPEYKKKGQRFKGAKAQSQKVVSSDKGRIPSCCKHLPDCS
jgi:hypothetical protein